MEVLTKSRNLEAVKAKKDVFDYTNTRNVFVTKHIVNKVRKI